jgi:predicted transport protein
MPLFQLGNDSLSSVAQSDFPDERTLQRLIERNLKVVFNFRFVASEFSTGVTHAGRIDTLALSEDGNPVIIEYKRVASSELVNQSLFYLSWIQDHHGDFEIQAQKELGSKIEIDWSDIRVICLAPNYKKYDLHAVQVMGANIELWTYRLFANGALYLEEVLQKSVSAVASSETAKNPVMVTAGKKAATTRALGGWTFAQHFDNRPEYIQAVLLGIQEFMLSLDPAMEESPKKQYVAYRTTQNIACAEVQKQKILLFLKLDPSVHLGPPGISRDVSKIGHFGTGDLEITLRSADDLERSKPFMKLAYDTVGG